MSTTTPISTILPGFPFPVLTPIVGTPTYDSIKVLRRQLTANSSSVYSTRGDGISGHLILVLSPQDYIAQANVPFLRPTHPGEDPNINGTGTEAHIRALSAAYNKNMQDFVTYEYTDKLLKQLIIAAVPIEFLTALEDPVYSFSRVTTLQLLTYLTTRYANMTPEAISRNYSAFSKPFWQPPMPIETLFSTIATRVQFAASAQAPIADILVMQAAYDNVAATGLFTTYLERWRSKSIQEKTYAAFQTFMIEADRDRSSITAADAGYHAMAVVTKTDKSELQLFKEELILAQKFELQQLFKDELLKREQATTPSRKEHPTFYCHSHGITRNPNHTSKLCNNKKPGHKDSATLSNKMGGSTFVFGK